MADSQVGELFLQGNKIVDMNCRNSYRENRMRGNASLAAESVSSSEIPHDSLMRMRMVKRSVQQV